MASLGDVPISNVVRPKENRLTGLHFIQTKPYFDKMAPVIEIVDEILKNQDHKKLLDLSDGRPWRDSDEFVLFDMVKKASPEWMDNLLKTRQTAELAFRPHHGVHLGLLRTSQMPPLPYRNVPDGSCTKYYLKQAFSLFNQNSGALSDSISASNSMIKEIFSKFSRLESFVDRNEGARTLAPSSHGGGKMSGVSSSKNPWSIGLPEARARIEREYDCALQIIEKFEKNQGNGNGLSIFFKNAFNIDTYMEIYGRLIHEKSHEDQQKYFFTFSRYVERDILFISKYIDKPRSRIVDLGAGPGVLGLIARGLGHEVMSVDLENKFYTSIRSNFWLPERIHKVTFDQPLPSDIGFVDYVTGFNTGFHRPMGWKSKWQPEHWEKFLNNIREKHLKEGGKMFFNPPYSSQRIMNLTANDESLPYLLEHAEKFDEELALFVFR